jgi:CheY-like chemotaxis protein
MPARLLVVDDLESARLLVTLVLRRQGFEVAEADNGRAALAALAVQPADVVLTDLEMPEMDGLALLRELKARYPETPALVLSAHDDTLRVLTAIREGTLFGYLVNPVEPTVLTLAVNRALEFVRFQAIARDADRVTAMRELAATTADRILNPPGAALLVARRLPNGVDAAAGAELAQRLTQMTSQIQAVVQQMARIFRYAPQTIYGTLRQIDLTEATLPPTSDGKPTMTGPVTGGLQ